MKLTLSTGRNKCSFFLTFQEDHTVLYLTQTGVPTNEYENTLRNWKGYYWNSIKQSFGFGSFLM